MYKALRAMVEAIRADEQAKRFDRQGATADAEREYRYAAAWAAFAKHAAGETEPEAIIAAFIASKLQKPMPETCLELAEEYIRRADGFPGCPHIAAMHAKDAQHFLALARDLGAAPEHIEPIAAKLAAMREETE